MKITFSGALDPKTASDPKSYADPGVVLALRSTWRRVVLPDRTSIAIRQESFFRLTWRLVTNVIGITFETDRTRPFFGFAVGYTLGGTNGNGVPSGGTIHYVYTDLNPSRLMPSGVSPNPALLNAVQTLKVHVDNRNGNTAEYVAHIVSRPD
jgi:hypothetical protein